MFALSFDTVHCLCLNSVSNYFLSVSNDPASVQVTTVHETNIAINISTSDDRYFSFLVLVYSNGSLIEQDNNITKSNVYDIQDLTTATNYTVTVYTVNGNNLTSSGSTSRNFTTRKISF